MVAHTTLSEISCRGSYSATVCKDGVGLKQIHVIMYV